MGDLLSMAEKLGLDIRGMEWTGRENAEKGARELMAGSAGLERLTAVARTLDGSPRRG